MYKHEKVYFISYLTDDRIDVFFAHCGAVHVRVRRVDPVDDVRKSGAQRKSFEAGVSTSVFHHWR
jgi:hypothetical protein